ncbi:MAG TPA: hypothetical protein VFJ90_01495 [Candidatus Didemnitutus sp.]|nr:hypothetical protein [Candidatus Didemnitutus sp.]
MPTSTRQSLYVKPWHIDCRLAKELPDDTPVRGRFVANAIAGSFAAIVLTYIGWAYYSQQSISADTADWRQRISNSSLETTRLRKVSAEAVDGAARINQAYALVNSPLVVSQFLQEIGRTRPEQIRLDTIEQLSGVIYLRGGLRESSQRGSVLLGRYVDELRANSRVAPLFTSIVLTSLERNDQNQTINFEITLKLKIEAPAATP